MTTRTTPPLTLLALCLILIACGTAPTPSPSPEPTPTPDPPRVAPVDAPPPVAGPDVSATSCRCGDPETDVLGCAAGCCAESASHCANNRCTCVPVPSPGG